MYIHDLTLWNPPIIDNRLWKWTDKEPDCKISHRTKNYAYKINTKDGNVKVNVKTKKLLWITIQVN